MVRRKRFPTRLAAGGFILSVGVASITSHCSAAGPTTAPDDSPSLTSTATPAVLLGSFKSALQMLSDSDPAHRDAAREQLMGIAPSDLPTLREAVEQMRPLKPGVADALHEIVTQIFLAGQNTDGDTEHGFMGVMMRNYEAVYSDDPVGDDSELPIGVVVDMRLPGFAAYRMLHDGDIILSIAADKMDERRIHSSEEITSIIGEFAAGTHVRLQVLRHGRRTETTITLDSRPRELAPGEASLTVDRYRQTQEEKAQAFWTARFAPVVDDSIS